MKMIIRTIAALGFVAAFSSVSQAQFLTDAGSPLGGGGGLTGSVANYVPSSLSGPARGALMAVLNGGSSTPLVNALGGSTQATALGSALAALTQNPTTQTFIQAIQAYNALVDAGVGDGTPTTTAEAVQDLLQSLGAVAVR